MPYRSMRTSELYELIKILKEQLSILQNKSAKFGELYTPAYITIEINEIIVKIELIENIIKEKNDNGDELIEIAKENRDDIEKLYRFSEYYNSLIESALRYFGQYYWGKYFFKSSWSNYNYRQWYVSEYDFNIRIVKDIKKLGVNQVILDQNKSMEYFDKCFTVYPIIDRDRINLIIVNGIGMIDFHNLAIIISDISFNDIISSLGNLYRYSESGKNVIKSMTDNQVYQNGIYFCKGGSDLHIE